MKLKILKPSGTVCDKEVDMVEFPGKLGKFTVLKDHAPIVSSLVEGKIIYTVNNIPEEIDVVKGIVEIKDNIISVLVV